MFAGIGAALAALGGMALLLSVIGTYAILSLSVTRRTREIGIRSALGATPGGILRTLMGKTALPPAIGAAAGIALGQGLVAVRGIFAFRLPDSSGPWGLPLLGVADDRRRSPRRLGAGAPCPPHRTGGRAARGVDSQLSVLSSCSNQ